LGELETRPYDLDDPMLEGTRGDGRPRVRVYPWQGVAVVIGRGGKQHLELDTAAIAADAVHLYKRPGGGCAVVLDPGNVIVSVVLPLPGLSGITSAFAGISTWLTGRLAALDIPGIEQRGVSDLALGERKVGGSCVFRTRGLLYYSTTLLVDPNLDLVERYLPHPPREPDYRQGRRHRDFMGRLAGSTPWNRAPALAAALEPVLKKSVADLSESLILP
jgi:lipoate-protein ligase A